MLVDLVHTLRTQHERGRGLTEQIRKAAESGIVNEGLVTAVHAFTRMYRPHAAREDTVLFPAFRKLLSEKDYAELGEQFEEREHALFGPGGFEGIVTQVGQLEEQIGIANLNQFTPA